MTTIRPATSDETDEWNATWQARLNTVHTRHELPEAAIAALVARRIRQLADTAERAVGVLVEPSGAPVGFVVVGVPGQTESDAINLLDVWVDPEKRVRGHGRAAVEWARRWSAERGGRLFAAIDPADPAQTGLVSRLTVRAQQMMRRLTSPAALPAGVTGRPMTDAEFTGWRRVQEEVYAAGISASGAMSPEDARQRSAEQFDQLLPAGLATAGNSFWCVEAEDEVVATIWIGHAYQPGVSWVYAIEVGQRHRGHGYGRAAMAVGERAALAAGDNWLGLNVFGNNHVAIALYTSMSYTPFEQQRSTP